MALSLRRFRKMLLASGLIEAAELRAFERSPSANRRPSTADDFSDALVAAGKLTEFQAAEIRAGRGSALVLGNYVVLDRIGAGGMGQVFKAWHRRMQRTVALKTLPDQRAAGEDSVARFRREILSAAQLSHPNIVAAYDADVVQHVHFLVMEHVDGPNLADLVRERGPLPVALAVRYVLDAARGLAYAHQRGIVHRDVKPSNLIVGSSGSVKVLDLGLARSAAPTAGAELTMPGDVVGTLEYMAPEQAAGAPDVDQRADIYGLGCTLYRLITGEFPYRGPSAAALIAAHRDEKIPSLIASRDDVPRALDRLFKRMVAKQPAERFQTMDEVVRALEKLRLSDKRSSGAWNDALLEDNAEDPELAASARSNSAWSKGSSRGQSVRGRGADGDDESGDDLVIVSAAGGPVIFEPADGNDKLEAIPSTPLSAAGGQPGYVAPPVSPVTALVALVAAIAGISALAWLDSRPQAPISAAPQGEVGESGAAGRLTRWWSQSLGLPVSMTNSVGMDFVLIPPADDERSTEQVQTPFYYGAHELTVAQFRRFIQATGYRVAGNIDSKFPGGLVQGDRHPVVGVTAADAEAFCRWLSQIESATYRLPTQAEWAHACRGGAARQWWFGDDPATLHRYAWYQSNSGARTHQVGLLEANPFGLHDLVGNAAEWCVIGDPSSNAGGASLSQWRYALCGGCWSSPATALGPVEAEGDAAVGGLRLVLELPLEARWPRRSATKPHRSRR
ncbi:MAG TPA: bifunctional serine/threonine-protein kinase/formylglycine-generating enzyme family protein [Pirellulales bacterium]|nr:bifunctional serine/threonine-protein kinase/formylglycine-generating enzyme family protein [Pirellulales bacterium]